MSIAMESDEHKKVGSKRRSVFLCPEFIDDDFLSYLRETSLRLRCIQFYGEKKTWPMLAFFFLAMLFSIVLPERARSAGYAFVATSIDTFSVFRDGLEIYQFGKDVILSAHAKGNLETFKQTGGSSGFPYSCNTLVVNDQVERELAFQWAAASFLKNERMYTDRDRQFANLVQNLGRQTVELEDINLKFLRGLFLSQEPFKKLYRELCDQRDELVKLEGRSPRIDVLSQVYCENKLDKFQRNNIPDGYGAPFNVFSSNQELTVSASCSDEIRIDLIVGGGLNTQYIYKHVYRWTGSNWESFRLTGNNKMGIWFVGEASTRIPESWRLAGPRYIVAYICTRQADQSFRCGCRDKNCSVNYWQLQIVQSTSASQSDVALQ